MAAHDLASAFQAVAQLIDSGATLIGHRPLTGGVSAEITALKLLLPEGSQRELVVRRHGGAEWKPLAPNVAAAEFALLSELHAHDLPVPKPLLLDESGKLLPSPYLVMERVTGSTQVAAQNLGPAMQQMAGFLERLHGLKLEQLDVTRLPAREDPVAGALEYLPTAPGFAAARAAIADWQLAPRQEVLLHGDYWPGNVLWNHGELAAVIDWEDAAIGDPLSDVACCRCELMVAYSQGASDTFTRHYFAQSSADLVDLALWEVYVSSAALATMGDWGLDPAAEAARRAQTSEFLERALKQVTARL